MLANIAPASMNDAAPTASCTTPSLGTPIVKAKMTTENTIEPENPAYAHQIMSSPHALGVRAPHENPKRGGGGPPHAEGVCCNQSVKRCKKCVVLLRQRASAARTSIAVPRQPKNRRAAGIFTLSEEPATVSTTGVVCFLAYLRMVSPCRLGRPAMGVRAPAAGRFAHDEAARPRGR